MRSGGAILLVFAFWIASGLFAFVKTRQKSREATQAALYLVSYPAVVALFVLHRPLEAALAAPLVMAGLPWLMAGIHLNKVLADPSYAKPGEFVGFPIKAWGWGLGLSFLLGLLLG